MYHHDRGSSPLSDTQNGKISPKIDTPLEHAGGPPGCPPRAVQSCLSLREAAVTSALIPPVIPRRPAAGSRPRGTPAVVRTLPMAASHGQVPALATDVVYGLGRIDASGRVADRRV